MSLIQFVRILWARRLILAVSVIGCLVAALIVGRALPARYQAHSRVMLDVVKPDPVTGEVINSAFARAYVRTQIELIRDYRIAGRVADLLGWTSAPELAAQYRARPEGDTRDFRRWLAQRVIDGTSAQLIEGSNILEISYTASDPEVAAKVADTVRQAYVDQAIAFTRDDAANNATWFRQQAERLRAQLTEAEKRLNDFERANGIVLDQELIDQESRRLAAIASSTTVQAPTVSAPVVTPGNPMAAQLAEADAAIANAEKVLGPNHPDLIQMRRNRAAIASAAAAAAPRVAPARPASEGPSVEAMFGSQQARVLAKRGLVDQARHLATDVALLRDQYQKTAARAGELEQQGQSMESGLTLLGNATAPVTPIFPNWPLLILGSIALGLVLGVLVSLLIELLGRRVRGVEDLRIGDVPVLGTMTPLRRARAGGRLSRLGLPERLSPQAA